MYATSHRPWQRHLLLEQKKCEVSEGHISNRVTSDCHHVLDLAEVFLKGFNGTGGGPQSCNAGLIGFQFGVSDGAIGGVQVGEYVSHRNISKTKGVVIKSSQV